MNRQQLETIMATAQHGTVEEKARLVELLGNVTSGNIHILIHLSNDDNSQVGNASVAWLEQLSALIENDGK